MKRLCCLTSLITVIAAAWASGFSVADDTGANGKKGTKSLKVTVLLRGVHSEESATVLRKALKEVKGIRFDEKRITPGEKPRYYTKPFQVTIQHPNETHIGALAEAVSKAKTPRKEEIPPLLSLCLYTKMPIEEEALTNLRSELQEVNGIKVLARGGLRGWPTEGFYSIQLEGAGGAQLELILPAARKAIEKFSLLPPKKG